MKAVTVQLIFFSKKFRATVQLLWNIFLGWNIFQGHRAIIFKNRPPGVFWLKSHCFNHTAQITPLKSHSQITLSLGCFGKLFHCWKKKFMKKTGKMLLMIKTIYTFNTVVLFFNTTGPQWYYFLIPLGPSGIIF